MTQLSSRLDLIKPSATLTISQAARQLQREGHDVLSLSAGEPDFPTPPNVIQAAKKAMDDGFTKYTAVGGTLDLKKTVINKFAQENDLTYELEEVVVSAGAKQILYNALMATLNPKDEVVIPAPYWVSYVDMVNLAEGKPVVITCTQEQNFKMTPQHLQDHISSKTKWLILNSPSNPTGAVYSEEELCAIGEVLRAHPNVLVMSDDIYEHILYTQEPFKTLAQVAPDLKNRVLTINGVSKAYSMTGWRIGYAGGPADLISAIIKIQSQSTSNPCSISQMAAIEALTGPQDFLKPRCEEFKKRCDYVVNRLNQIEGLACLTPEGSFYAYPNCSGVVGRQTPSGMQIESDGDFSQYLIETAQVAVVPGNAFGMSPYFRVSYATDMKTLEKALDRIEKAVQDLS